MKKKFSINKLCVWRIYFIFFYLVAIVLTAHYVREGYNSFFEKKKSIMELAAYKISSDFINILNHAEDTLNGINKKIVRSGGSKANISDILIYSGRNYNDNLLQYELSTGKFYWIDAENQLIANSEYGLIANAIDLSGRDYLQKTSSNPEKIYTGEPIIGASSGQFVIPVGVGAENAQGHYIGTMAVSFKLSELTARYSEIADLNQVNFAVLNSENKIIFESEDGVFSRDKKLFSDLAAKEINESEEFVAPYSLRDRKNSYVILRASDKYPYKIITGYQNKVLQQELSFRIIIWAAQFLLITMFFMSAMFYLCKEDKDKKKRK